MRWTSSDRYEVTTKSPAAPGPRGVRYQRPTNGNSRQRTASWTGAFSFRRLSWPIAVPFVLHRCGPIGNRPSPRPRRLDHPIGRRSQWETIEPAISTRLPGVQRGTRLARWRARTSENLCALITIVASTMRLLKVVAAAEGVKVFVIGQLARTLRPAVQFANPRRHSWDKDRPHHHVPPNLRSQLQQRKRPRRPSGRQIEGTTPRKDS